MVVSQHFHDMFHTIAKILYCIGMDFLDPNYMVNSRMVLFFVGAILSVILSVYTIGFLDYNTRLKCLTLAPTILQGLLKSIVFSRNAKLLRSALNQINHIYDQCDGQAAEERILIPWVRIMVLVSKGFRFVMVLVLGAFFLLPIFSYYVLGEKDVLLPLMMPYLDMDTYWGYIGQISVQTYFLVLAGLGIVSAELSIFTFIIQVGPMSDLLILKLDMLQNRCSDQAGPSGQRVDFVQGETKARVENRDFLHNIVKMHVEYIQYMNLIMGIFYEILLVEMLMNAVSLCLLMFLLMQMFWMPLYSYLLMFVIKTFTYSLLGTCVEIYVSTYYT